MQQKNKQKLLVSILSMMMLIVIISFSFALAGCGNNNERLATPNVRIDLENNIINWDAVENANGFRFEFGDEFYQLTGANMRGISFANRLEQIRTGAYTLRVIALGDGVNFLDSYPAAVDFYFYTPADRFSFQSIFSLNGTLSYAVSWNSNVNEQKIYVPRMHNGRYVTAIGGISWEANILIGCFNEMPTLESIVLPDTIEQIGRGAFADTGLYKNAVDGIIYADNWAVGIMDDTTGVIRLRNGTVGIADAAFLGARYIAGAILPNNLRYIGMGAFVMSGISSVNIPSSVVHIGGDAFWQSSFYNNSPPGAIILDGWLIGIRHLLLVDLDLSYEKIIGIADAAFFGQRHLYSITLPDTVVHIGERAFWELGHWNGGDFFGTEITIYVPFVRDTWHPRWNNTRIIEDPWWQGFWQTVKSAVDETAKEAIGVLIAAMNGTDITAITNANNALTNALVDTVNMAALNAYVAQNTQTPHTTVAALQAAVGTRIATILENNRTAARNAVSTLLGVIGGNNSTAITNANNTLTAALTASGADIEELNKFVYEESSSAFVSVAALQTAARNAAAQTAVTALLAAYAGTDAVAITNANNILTTALTAGGVINIAPLNAYVNINSAYATVATLQLGAEIRVTRLNNRAAAQAAVTALISAYAGTSAEAISSALDTLKAALEADGVGVTVLNEYVNANSSYATVAALQTAAGIRVTRLNNHAAAQVAVEALLLAYVGTDATAISSALDTLTTALTADGVDIAVLNALVVQNTQTPHTTVAALQVAANTRVTHLQNQAAAEAAVGVLLIAMAGTDRTAITNANNALTIASLSQGVIMADLNAFIAGVSPHATLAALQIAAIDRVNELIQHEASHEAALDAVRTLLTVIVGNDPVAIQNAINALVIAQGVTGVNAAALNTYVNENSSHATVAALLTAAVNRIQELQQ